MTAEGVGCCISYESWCNCVEAAWEALRGLKTWDRLPFISHLTCTISFFTQLLAQHNTYSISNSTHIEHTHTVFINSFSKATLTHSVYYATSHKQMIFWRGLRIIVFQSCVNGSACLHSCIPREQKKQHKNIHFQWCFWLAAEWKTPVKQLHSATTWCHELCGQHAGFLRPVQSGICHLLSQTQITGTLWIRES